MKNRQQAKQTMNQMMKQYIRDQLMIRGVQQTCSGNRLHDASYADLKWTLAFIRAVREEG